MKDVSYLLGKRVVKRNATTFPHNGLGNSLRDCVDSVKVIRQCDNYTICYGTPRLGENSDKEYSHIIIPSCVLGDLVNKGEATHKVSINGRNYGLFTFDLY